MTLLIPYLVVVLLVVGIVAVLRLWSVLGSVRVTLANLETTRQEVTETVKRLNVTVATADKLMLEEVAPTLQAARATLANVEVTTRALAETTNSLRRITGKAATANDARQLITAGSMLAQAMARRKQGGAAKAAGKGLLATVGAGIMGLFTRGRKTAHGNDRTVAKDLPSKALPAATTIQSRSDGRGRALSAASSARETVLNGEELKR
jgi:hypothetical protein